MAVISLFGVTSKAGLKVFIFSGAICIPWIWVISFPFRSSIGISEPDFLLKSKVLEGEAT